MEQHQERRISDLFDVGLILKAITSVLEIGSGIAVLFVSRAAILHATLFATQGELARDPDDLVANYLRQTAHTFAIHTHYLLGSYLILRGVLTLALVILVLRGIIGAYPYFIIVFGFLASYEAYRAIPTHNIWLGLVAILDTALIFLAAYDYKRRRSVAPKRVEKT